MKLFLFVILAGSLLALGPNTRMPQHYDDTLFNNIGREMKEFDAVAQTVSTHPLLMPVSKVQILRHCALNMHTEDFNNAVSIIKEVLVAAKKGDSHKTFHAFFAAFDYANEVARTYELTLVKKGASIVAVLTKKNHEITKSKKFSFYFETYESLLGLPFTNLKRGPRFDSEVTEDMIVFLRTYLLKSAMKTRGSQKNAVNALGGIFENITSATNAVDQIAGTAAKLINTFKNTKSETVKEILKGEGFRSYSSRSRFLRSLGVPSAKYDVYMKAYKTLTGLKKSKYSEEIDAILSVAEFLEDNNWCVNDFIFDKGKGSCNSVITLTRANMMEGVTHFLTVNLTGSFTLAPDVMIITKHKSIVGGLFENTKDVRKEVPKNISDEEIKAIQSVMLLNSIKIMADSFKVPFTLPADSPTKM